MPNYTPSTFIWTPPPAAAIEQVRRVRTKHEDSTHVVLILRLILQNGRDNFICHQIVKTGVMNMIKA